MTYLQLEASEREALIENLEAMPAFLERMFAALSAEVAASGGPENGFSPVEHCWHLADLDREGFGARLRCLREQDNPVLPDFDGGRIAEERNYKARSVAAGIASFRRARRDNLAVIRSLRADEWCRSGTQEGIGRVSLCDIPGMMFEHDSEHRTEIEMWSKTANLT